MFRLDNFRANDRVGIIAEIGVNHEGNRRVAEDLIDKAAQAGADLVKFQTFIPEYYVSTVQPERLERVRRFQLSYDDFRILANRAREKDVTFFSTPLHPDNVDFLDEIAPLFKISSGDLTFVELIRHAATKGKPMIISTGLGSEEEIRSAIAAAEAGSPGICERGHLMLMHCVAAYPVSYEEANVRNVRWLERTFGLPTGYSDHTLGIKACEMAVAVGAVALEKHFTYRKEDQDFHDHAISADPSDMAALVKCVRHAEVILGTEIRTRGLSEKKNMENMRRSIGAKRDIPADMPIAREWLVPLRPAWGVPIERIDEVVGNRTIRNIAAGDLIKEEDLKS